MYTLRFPFSIPQNKEIEGLGVLGEINSLMYTLNKQDEFYILTIDGFLTEDTANKYINNIWAGFMWLLFHRGLPPDAVFELSKVVYTKDPCQAAKSYGFKDSIDGFIDRGRPAVFPTKKRIVTETAGKATPLQTYSANYVLNRLHEGASFPTSEKIIQSLKLRLAFDLYGAYFTENSTNAKFLTLILALETLKLDFPPTHLTLDLINKCKQEAKDLQKNIKVAEPCSEDIESLETLIVSLRHVSKKSIGNGIKHLVLTTLQKNGDEDAEEMAKRAKEIYVYRGKLVHDGKLELSLITTVTADAKNIVERVLKAKFIELAHKKHS